MQKQKLILIMVIIYFNNSSISTNDISNGSADTFENCAWNFSKNIESCKRLAFTLSCYFF